MPIDLSKLNPQQRRAVMHDEGPLLVLAGAGSGKTRVVTYRTARLLDDGVDASRILVVTFTNKAAAEMRGRIVAMVGKTGADALTCSTFHSFGYRILRQTISRLGYRPPITVVDTADQLKLVKAALDDLGLGRTSARPDGILRIISRAKRARVTPASLREMRFSPLLPYAQRVFDAYQAQLRALSSVDFDDLLALPLYLCDEDEEIRQRLATRFDYVMVDEFQDTNTVQLDLMQRVSGNGNIMAVGDDDQSIYAFQGALSDHIIDFGRYFPGAQVIKLEQNYRSTDRILKAANALISHNTTRHDKRLWSDRGDGPKIRFVSCADEREEASFVARDIADRGEELGAPYHDTAILYRINSQSRLFEEALRMRRVPYKVIGSTELFDRAEVRDWIAYLKLALNPRDDLSFRRLANTPRRGLGPTAMARIEAAAVEMGAPLLQALRDARTTASLSSTAQSGAAELLSLLDNFGRPLRSARGHALSQGARALLGASGMVEHIRRSEKDPGTAERRAQTLEQLIDGMAQMGEETSLAAYLASVSLDSHVTDRKDGDRDGVTLLTIHSAKGLEFKNVYLVGFEMSLLPHKRSMETPSAIAEERRLCYVGMTRAMDRLTLTAARTRTRRNERLPRQVSLFYDEIPVELIEADGEVEALESSRMQKQRSYLAQIQEILRSDEPKR